MSMNAEPSKLNWYILKPYKVQLALTENNLKPIVTKQIKAGLEDGIADAQTIQQKSLINIPKP